MKRDNNPDRRFSARNAWRDATSQFSEWRDVTSQFAAALQQPKTLRERLRTDKKMRTVAFVMLAIILFCMIPTPILAFTTTYGLAKDGQAHLKNAENDFKLLASKPTNLALINDAQNELQASHNDFFQLQIRLSIASPASALPSVGSKISGAEKLIPLAVEGTQAGVYACDALKVLLTGLKNPLGTSGGLTSADTDQVASDFDQVRALFGQIEPVIMTLTQSDLSLAPSLWKTIVTVQEKMPEIVSLVNDFDGVAHALPTLLGVGKPAPYLVEVLDSSELRPTGGFIGNFGVLSLDQGRLDPGFHISDITLIDSSVKFDQSKDTPNVQVIPIPDRYTWLRSIFVDPWSASWSLRDSNLDPNYPTVAQYAMQLYPQLLPMAQENLDAHPNNTIHLYDPSKSGQFVGVISLSLGFFAQALTAVGGVTVSDGPIHENVDASNFVAKIHYYALYKGGSDALSCGDTSCAKVFTSDVVKAFMQKFKSNLPLYIGKIGKLVYDSLKTKDVEIFVTNPDTEQALQDLKMGSTVAAPKTGDSVFAVDTNIGANKDNSFLQYQMSDGVSLDDSGDATHHLHWQYFWPDIPPSKDGLTPGTNPYVTPNLSYPAGSPDYHSYSRVFTPLNAKLISQLNMQNFNSDTEFDRNAFAGDVYAHYLQTSKYGVAWSVPNAVTHDSTGYHYHVIYQREAGIVWPLTITVTLPSCVSTAAQPVTSGLQPTDKVTVAGNVVTITTNLMEDEQFQFDWNC